MVNPFSAANRLSSIIRSLWIKKAACLALSLLCLLYKSLIVLSASSYVLNLGIPHAKMENIVEFAKVELPNLHPDIIILYAGYNDATHPKDSRSVSNLYKLREWLYLHSVLWRTLHSALKTLY